MSLKICALFLTLTLAPTIIECGFSSSYYVRPTHSHSYPFISTPHILAPHHIREFEGDVKQGNLTTVVDMDWFGSHTKWYLPLWSQFYRYRTASELLDEDETKVNPAPQACLIFPNDNQISGFGKKQQYDITATPTGIKFKAPTSFAKWADFTFSLTDNTHFVLGVTRWEDDKYGWAVLTPGPTLDHYSAAKVMEAVRLFGFDERYAHPESYHGCSSVKE